MKYYVQFMLICLFAVIGEALSTFFKLPVPGSIIGLFLLLIALQLKWIRLRHIHAVAEFLIAQRTFQFKQFLVFAVILCYLVFGNIIRQLL